jgi:hypothetical protein
MEVMEVRYSTLHHLLLAHRLTFPQDATLVHHHNVDCNHDVDHHDHGHTVHPQSAEKIKVTSGTGDASSLIHSMANASLKDVDQKATHKG